MWNGFSGSRIISTNTTKKVMPKLCYFFVTHIPMIIGKIIIIINFLLGLLKKLIEIFAASSENTNQNIIYY